MGKFLTPFENFAFKSFDFSGRATLLEYWLLMPLIWGLIIFLAYGDAVEFWGFLLQRQVPPLNPLYWDSIVVFVLTLIPRLSLTVRRLHDSGKSGKWAKLPFVALTSGAVMSLGVFSALATHNAAHDNISEGLGIITIFMAITFNAADSVWSAIFATAAFLNTMGWDAVIGMLAELTAIPEQNNVGSGLASSSTHFKDTSGAEAGMLLYAVFLIATPFVATFLHIFFMISPSKADHDLGGSAPIAGASLRKKGDTSDNPFAGYKYLYAKSPEQQAAHKAAARAEVKSLYQKRVLGQ